MVISTHESSTTTTRNDGGRDAGEGVTTPTEHTTIRETVIREPSSSNAWPVAAVVIVAMIIGFVGYALWSGADFVEEQMTTESQDSGGMEVPDEFDLNINPDGDSGSESGDTGSTGTQEG